MSLWQWIAELGQWRDVYGNTAQRWLVAGGVFLAAAILLLLIKSIVVRRVTALAEKSTLAGVLVLRTLVERTRSWFLLALAVYFAALALELPDDIKAIVQSVGVILLLLQAALWGHALLNLAVARYSQQRVATDAASATTIAVLGFLSKLVLWSVVVLVALANAGIDVTAVVAGLGIGGIAVALAAQNILGDLFASIAIMIDRPFVLGDFIAVGEFQGTIERIGVKTTRLRSLTGEQLIFGNHDLLQSRIRNFKRMTERRVLFTVGVTYQTPHEKLARVSPLLREIVESQSPVRFDRAHFKTLGDSALVFEVVYYVLTPNFVQYMDIQQAINLAIFQRFEQEQIEFAYPTQTVFVKGIDLTGQDQSRGNETVA